MTRRELFTLTGASLLTPSLFAKQQESSSTPGPELIVFNARVITVDSRQPRAEAFALKNGRFLAVGSNADIRNLIHPGTPIWNAQGGAIVPGFIDTHNHANGTTLLYEVLVGNPFEVEFVTIDSIIQKLRVRASQLPPGYWVEGYFFDDTKVKDGRQLSIHDLDQVSKDRPVAVDHRGGHTSYYNSKAFEMAGVDRQTPNPPGGTFDKDSMGALNGRVTDEAKSVFYQAGKRQTSTTENSGLDAPGNSLEREMAGLGHISKMFARYGVTTVHHESAVSPRCRKCEATET